MAPDHPPTLISAASPEAGSACPMFDLVDPISRGSWRVAHRARMMLFSSWGSPTCGGLREVRTPPRHLSGMGCGVCTQPGRALTLVPVPWASIYSRDSGVSPADSYRERMSCSCTSPEGKVTPVGGARPQHTTNHLTACSPTLTLPGMLPPCSLKPSVLVPALRMVAYTRRARDFLVSKTATTASARQ